MGIFGGLYVVFCLFLGLTLAILLDQKIRGEGILRPIYLYPLALSFIVTGTAWKLLLDPRIGLEKAMHDSGWTSFHFDWVVEPRMMIYCVAIAGIWQTSGFVMAMFLAGLSEPLTTLLDSGDNVTGIENDHRGSRIWRSANCRTPIRPITEAESITRKLCSRCSPYSGWDGGVKPLGDASTNPATPLPVSWPGDGIPARRHFLSIRWVRQTHEDLRLP